MGAGYRTLTSLALCTQPKPCRNSLSHSFTEAKPPSLSTLSIVLSDIKTPNGGLQAERAATDTLHSPLPDVPCVPCLAVAWGPFKHLLHPEIQENIISHSIPPYSFIRDLKEQTNYCSGQAKFFPPSPHAHLSILL